MNRNETGQGPKPTPLEQQWLLHSRTKGHEAHSLVNPELHEDLREAFYSGSFAVIGLLDLMGAIDTQKAAPIVDEIMSYSMTKLTPEQREALEKKQAAYRKMVSDIEENDDAIADKIKSAMQTPSNDPNKPVVKPVGVKIVDPAEEKRKMDHVAKVTGFDDLEKL